MSTRFLLLILGALGIVLGCLFAALADYVNFGVLGSILTVLTFGSTVGGFLSIGMALTADDEKLPKLYKG